MPAMGQFLDAVAEPQLEVPAAGVRRGLAEDGLPLLLQLGHRHRLQRGQFGQDVDPLRLAREARPLRLISLCFSSCVLSNSVSQPVSDDGV